MQIKTLKKSAELLKRLEAIDQGIIQTEQFAMKIQDKDLSINLSMSYEIQKTASLPYDEEGNEVTPFTPYSFFSGMLINCRSSEHKPDTEGISQYISEIVTLQILGVIIAHKEAERMAIMSDLRKAGFAI